MAAFACRLRSRYPHTALRPAVEWVEVAGWAVLLRQSTGVRMSTPGDVELMAARDARAEKCDAEGGSGSDAGKHRFEWRIGKRGFHSCFRFPNRRPGWFRIRGRVVTCGSL